MRTYIYGDNIPFYDVNSGPNSVQCPSGYNLCTGVGSWNEGHGTLNATLGFATPSQTLVAGQPSTPMALDLSSPAPTGGISISLSSHLVDGRLLEYRNGPLRTHTFRQHSRRRHGEWLLLLPGHQGR